MVHNPALAEHHGHHIVPKRTLIKVFVALVFLTILTVSVVMVDLGPLNVPIALGIAAVKASLVVLIFMGLKYDRPMHALVLSIGVLFVVLFLTFTLFDTAFRGDLGNVAPETIADMQRQEQALQEREARLSGGAAADPSAAADTSAAAADTSAADTTAAAGADTTSAAP